MKTQLILLFILSAVSVTAQKNFYEAIEHNGTDAIYEGFSGLSANGDGTYNFKKGKPAVKLAVTKLPSGQPVGFKATPTTESYGGFSETEISDYGRVDSYPNVMSIKHDYTDDGYMMIDDLLFVVNNIPDNGVPKLANVTKIYVMVKDRSDVSKNNKSTKKKKKKGGFLGRMKAKLEAAATKTSPTFKYIKTVNIEKKFNDYVSTMKAKQATPLTAKDKADIAKIKHAREAGDAEIKRYNDSIKATPEYQDLQRRIKQNEANYQASKSRNTVTLRNNTGHTIYVGKSGSRNPGTEITSGGTASWSCSADAYLQTVTKSGGSNAYRSTSTRVYRANSGCGSTVTIN